MNLPRTVQLIAVVCVLAMCAAGFWLLRDPQRSDTQSVARATLRPVPLARTSTTHARDPGNNQADDDDDDACRAYHQREDEEDQDDDPLTFPQQALDKPAVHAFLMRYFGLTNDVDGASPLFTNATAFCESRRRLIWEELHRVVSPALHAALRRQQRRHEAVARGCPRPGQKYLVWSLSGGLGNRFQAVVSCLVAAMLSGRVLLLKDWFTPLPPSRVKQTPVVLPSPFTDHYYLEDLSKLRAIPEGEGDRPRNEALLCPLFPMMSLREFRERYPHEFGKASGGVDPRAHPEHAKVDISARHDKTLRRWNRLLCTNMSAPSPLLKRSADATAAAARVFFPEKFVYIWTNQFFLPAFFLNPHHAAQMHAMFPGATSDHGGDALLRKSGPYSTLVRAFVAPALPVVQRVRAFFRANPQLRPGMYTALQVRAFQVSEIVPLGTRFQACFDQQSDSKASAPFFLATLHEAVRSGFAKKYGAERVVTLAPAIGEQRTGGGARFEQEAMSDMFLLALGKELFVSPGSTFGSFVVAYTHSPARLVTPDGGCRRGRHIEPCFAALHWYDKLLARADKLTCKLQHFSGNNSGC